MNAYEWGWIHGSCAPALEWRRSLGEKATQRDAWKKCQRGGWLLWQIGKLPDPKRSRCLKKLCPVVEGFVARAIRIALRSIRRVTDEWATGYRRWAKRWLSGEDRSRVASSAAADAAAEAAWAARAAEAAWAAGSDAEAAGSDARAAEVAEQRRQALEIRRVIQAWPGGVE